MEASYDRRRYDQYPNPARPPPNPPSSFYPRISPATSAAPPVSRPPPPVPGPAPSAGIGIKVALKQEFCVAPPVQLSPLVEEVPRTAVHFDFDFERKVIADAERGVRTQVTHSQLANGGDTAASSAHAREDPVISKYLSLGLNKEAVVRAIASHGDVQSKVVEFCSSYGLLTEMGFPPDAVAAALVMYDNDKEKALAHFV